MTIETADLPDALVVLDVTHYPDTPDRDLVVVAYAGTYTQVQAYLRTLLPIMRRNEAHSNISSVSNGDEITGIHAVSFNRPNDPDSGVWSHRSIFVQVYSPRPF
jgi:hypothetical protein